MQLRKVSIFAAVVLSEFVFYAGDMFFNRAFLKLVPYPFFVTFANSLLVVPAAFFAAWAGHHFPRNCDHLLPHSKCLIWIAAGALLESGISILYTVSYYASMLDFVIIMRLSGIVWNGVLGFVFLGERISFLGFCSVALIVVGMFIIFSNFQWSVALLTSKIQILIQLVAIFLNSLASLVTKKILLIIDSSTIPFSILDYLAWSALLSLPSTFLIWAWEEPQSLRQISSILSLVIMGLLIFGTLIHEFLHFLIAQVHKRASMISMGVLAQVKLLGTLWISHFVYRETVWNQYNFTGLGLLIIGGVVYTLTRIGDNNGAHQLPSEDTATQDHAELPIYEEDENSAALDDSEAQQPEAAPPTA